MKSLVSCICVCYYNQIMMNYYHCFKKKKTESLKSFCSTCFLITVHVFTFLFFYRLQRGRRKYGPWVKTGQMCSIRPPCVYVCDFLRVHVCEGTLGGRGSRGGICVTLRQTNAHAWILRNAVSVKRSREVLVYPLGVPATPECSFFLSLVKRLRPSQ